MSRVLAVLVALAGCSQPMANGAPADAPRNQADGHDVADGPKGSGTPDAGSGGATSAVQIIVEPDGQNAKQLLDAIDNAQSSIEMTMYEIDNTTILTALENRAKAGVSVKAILDSSSTNKSSNTPAFNALKSAGASVVWSSSSFTYTHEKTLIFDDQTAWIMTMNLNISPPKDNREYLAIDTDAGDVAEAKAVFDADFAMHSISPTGSLVVANNNARPSLVALLNAATKTIDLEGEELSDTDSNGIVDALVAASRRGVTVHCVIATETSLSSSQTNAIKDIKQGGGTVVMTGPTSDAGTSSNPYIHAKAIVIDCDGGTTACTKGFVGSENFSAGSLGYNRELGVIFDDATQLGKVAGAIEGDYANGKAQ